MVKSHIVKLLILSIIILVYGNESYSLTLVFDEMKSNKGKVLISVFTKEKSFPADHTKAFKIMEVNAAEGEFTFDSLPKNIYAVSICHDENGNRQCDMNFLGIPKEGVGVSNNVVGFLGPPSFSDAKFLLDRNLKITVVIRY